MEAPITLSTSSVSAPNAIRIIITSVIDDRRDLVLFMRKFYAKREKLVFFGGHH